MLCSRGRRHCQTRPSSSARRLTERNLTPASRAGGLYVGGAGHHRGGLRHHARGAARPGHPPGTKKPPHRHGRCRGLCSAPPVGFEPTTLRLRGQVVWCPPARLVSTDSRDPLRRYPRIPRGSVWGRDPVQEHVRARPPGCLRIHNLVRQLHPDVRLTPVQGTADLVHGLPRRPIEHLNSACKHQPRKHHRVDGIGHSRHRGRSSRPAPRLPGRPGGPRPPTARCAPGRRA